MNLGTKSQLKLTILYFGATLAQKEYFKSEKEKMKITTEFYMFDFTCSISFFETISPKKDTSGRKKKKKMDIISSYPNKS